MTNCPLCKSEARHFQWFREMEYLQCDGCSALFLHPRHLPSPQEEQERYKEHNNDVEDPGYQKFVAPIVDSVLQDWPPQTSGLDFGAGTGPVISKLLGDQGYNLRLYDPFFWKDPAPLEDRYDFIVCCEVVEHFHNPEKEFRLLSGLLKPGGRLYCMTEAWDPSVDFQRWHYKNDPTHVFFYHPHTFRWIRDNLGFSGLELQGRLAVLRK
ncbi:class I SAM-dependent methyltransferase [Anaerotalea alkaliphila]|uniref:Class I SAM-dependent methyltransferase n=1 Tax=Anaerotalea alkaliphila TaxID=2662126 RepID=A0A7X5KLF6_9FIRM|nr:class I SAM-dependent methyltransferase [Anaerotalea alkaliphila]NDL66664.1 class I SAM-dependent methyltransferase [Anaerotalea alkaliphila]